MDAALDSRIVKAHTYPGDVRVRTNLDDDNRWADTYVVGCVLLKAEVASNAHYFKGSDPDDLCALMPTNDGSCQFTRGLGGIQSAISGANGTGIALIEADATSWGWNVSSHLFWPPLRRDDPRQKGFYRLEHSIRSDEHETEELFQRVHDLHHETVERYLDMYLNQPVKFFMARLTAPLRRY